MKLPKLEALEFENPGNGSMFLGIVPTGIEDLTNDQAAECIRRVELHDELVEALGVELKDAEEDMAENGLPFIQKRIDRLQAVLNKSQGA